MRYLTINTVIRKYQMETNRTDHLLEDETELHDVEAVLAFSEAVRQGFPEARITWALSWQALVDPTERYSSIRAALRDFHQHYGDEVTFIPGGYACNTFQPRAEICRDITDALEKLTTLQNGDQPMSLIAGSLSAEVIRYVRERHGIKSVQGNQFSQFSIDLNDSEGSLAYPYYPSTQHFCKPAQDENDNIDCLNLDGWTIDLIAGRLAGEYTKDGVRYVSRMGVGPLETLHTFGPAVGLREMQATTEAHFCAANVARNPFAWVTNNYEIGEFNRSRLNRTGNLETFRDWLAWIRQTWPDVQCPTQAEFGEQVRTQHPTNETLIYLLQQRGSGIGASIAGQEVTWLMNQHFRLGIARQDEEQPYVFDYTDYARAYAEPQEIGQRNWSIFGDINQKQTRPQDRPLPLAKFFARWPEMETRVRACWGERQEVQQLLSDR